ncbi:glycosyltransferase family 61 protein [Acidomonas methanolica]|uniref:glycosyltransferase family 61 protein n=1 Tax=Acidomonas methanolica TaxID=437 RepID=UPI00211A6AE5|nr:glycosyltransferase 61 family protein [Acidomonas methanolica]MCQ9156394.1 glycosyltransferase family 61 protein [Acidomonas methanolica]
MRTTSLETVCTLREHVETCSATEIATLPPALLDRAEANPFLGYRSLSGEIFRYALKRVLLDRDTMTLLRRPFFGGPAVLIRETAYVQEPARLAALRVRRDAPRQRGPVTLCFDHWDQNYYHWVAHTLPTLGTMIEDHGVPASVLLPAHLKPWQRETVALLGLDPDVQPMIDYGEQRMFGRAFYCDYVRGTADFAVSARSRATYERMVRAAGGNRPGGRKLYIGRGGQTNRHVPNEAELEVRLAACGFTCVRPETLSVTAQIRLFREAEMVVGFLGAGLANIAWCAPGTLVYELVPSHHVNPCFAVMAHQGGLHYWADLIPSGVEAESHETGFARPVDVGAVLARVREIERLGLSRR